VIIEEGFAPVLIGDRAVDVEPFWRKMHERVWGYGPEGIADFAVTAVDMALWDPKRKGSSTTGVLTSRQPTPRQNPDYGIYHLRHGQFRVDG
jgi:hypothetical protein